MEKNKDIKKQEAEIVKQQKEYMQQTCINELIRVYQDTYSLDKYISVNNECGILGKSIKEAIIKCLSNMVTIVEKDKWYKIHPHEAFPKIDIRMLICECPVDKECPYLLSVLRKIGMSRVDYINYRKRAGMLVMTEYKRKIGKRR